jgi:hypothetical protein
LSLVEGSTENTTLVTELLVGLRERGLDVTRPILTVLDGSTVLRRAVLDVFESPRDRQMPTALCRHPDYADVESECAVVAVPAVTKSA